MTTATSASSASAARSAAPRTAEASSSHEETTARNSASCWVVQFCGGPGDIRSVALGDQLPAGRKRCPRAAELLDHHGVELRPTTLAKLGAGLLLGHRRAVGAVGGHRVEGVADGDDPRSERDL